MNRSSTTSSPLVSTNGHTPVFVVFKFGGTSVGAAARLQNVVRVVKEAAQTARVLVVNSALSRVTRQLDRALDAFTAGEERPDEERPDEVLDGLLDGLRKRHRWQAAEVLRPTAQMRYASVVEQRLAHLRDVFEEVARGGRTPARRDAILATGEQLAVPMVALALQDAGLDAIHGEAVGLLRTDRSFGAAQVDIAASRNTLRAWHDELAPTSVPVVAGFIGGTERGETTTLGFEGSDYSAALFASILNADVLVRYTDVDGLYTQDPRTHPDATLIAEMSMTDALKRIEAGDLGMHPKTLRPLAEQGIPLRIRSITDLDAPGTLIAPQPQHVTARVAP